MIVNESKEKFTKKELERLDKILKEEVREKINYFSVQLGIIAVFMFLLLGYNLVEIVVNLSLENYIVIGLIVRIVVGIFIIFASSKIINNLFEKTIRESQLTRSFTPEFAKKLLSGDKILNKELKGEKK